MTDRAPKATRRGFIKSGSAGLGLTVLAASKHAHAAPMRSRPRPRKNRLPREVWIASISQNELHAAKYDQMIRQMLARMEEVVCYEPDVICLPEVFPFVNIDAGRPPVSKVAEEPIGAISAPFAEFARKHDCYVVCPIYTRQAGKCYNSAVFIDRAGKAIGEYHKMHPTVGEMDAGVAPGTLSPPVFETDFGIVGAQICFDIEWRDGWEKLQQAGAEIVFWPSAFDGGTMVNTKAWENNYCVVSSTRKGVTKICDMTGEAVDQTSHWDRWVCAPLNLEKAFLHTWPFVQRFPEIRKKYGRKVRIHTFAAEEWSVIESRDPDIKVADVLREFELQTLKQHIGAADAAQRKARGI